MDDVAVPAEPVLETPAPPLDPDAGSLSEHEAAFAPNVAREPVGVEDLQPAKPRHRAASQRAEPDDVPAISEHTKRIKDAEAKLGADIVRKDGESERVFNLRRRAEVLERFANSQPLASPQSPSAPQASPVPAPAPLQPAPLPATVPQTFPSYLEWVALPGNEGQDYDAFVDARADWRYAMRRAQEREQETAERRQRTFTERSAAHVARVNDAKQKYADFDAVVTNDALISPVMMEAILASDQSADIAYYLGKHPDVRAELQAETQDYSPSAVATTRRYLDTLVAPQRVPSQPQAAGATGSAPRLVAPPAPRPPNPVRTGAVTPVDEPPGDESSLAAHEQFFGRSRRHR